MVVIFRSLFMKCMPKRRRVQKVLPPRTDLPPAFLGGFDKIPSSEVTNVTGLAAVLDLHPKKYAFLRK